MYILLCIGVSVSLTGLLYLTLKFLLVGLVFPILTLTKERYISKDNSIRTKAMKKWITSHEISRRARFQHISIFFLELLFSPKNPMAPLVVSTTFSRKITVLITVMKALITSQKSVS